MREKKDSRLNVCLCVHERKGKGKQESREEKARTLWLALD